MKKNYVVLLALYMLGNTANSYSTPGNCSKGKRIKINHGIIGIIDGTPKVPVKRLLRLINNITTLREGKRSNKTAQVEYHGQVYNVRELAEKEHKGGMNGKAIERSLDSAIEQFRSFSAEYLNEARGFKSQMEVLIATWAKQRNIQNSILLDWSKQAAGKEHEEFKKLVKSFTVLDEFLDHLGCFLLDMLQSCETSRKQYSESKEGRK